VRLVINRDVGMHLPHPRVLDREGEGLAGPVALKGEHDKGAVATLEECRRAGFHVRDPIDQGNRGQFEPPGGGRLLRLGDLGGGVGGAGAGRPHTGLDEETVFAVAGGGIQQHRQHIGHRRTGIPTLGVRPLAAEHQQAATPFADEVGNHPKLVGREEIRLDTPQDDRAVLEQLFAGPGESADQILGVFDTQPHELVFRRALQRSDLQVLVVVHRPPDELELPARLALEVEDFLACILDDDQGIPLVVLGDHFIWARGHPETEQARTGVGRGEPDPHRGRLAVGGQRHLLVGHDPAFVLHLHADGLTGIPVLRQQDIDHQRGALEHRAWRVHPAQLDVAAVFFAAEADREHRHPGRLERHERVGQFPAGVVGAVGHHHHPRQRHPGQFLVRTGQRLPQMRPGAVKRQIVD